MTWKLFIDDERYPPDDGTEYVICRNLNDVKREIENRGMPMFITFDHDLGEDEPTGYDIVKHLCELDMDNIHTFPDDFDFYVHSQNVSGAENIRCYMNNYLKFKMC